MDSLLPKLLYACHFTNQEDSQIAKSPTSGQLSRQLQLLDSFLVHQIHHILAYKQFDSQPFLDVIVLLPSLELQLLGLFLRLELAEASEPPQTTSHSSEPNPYVKIPTCLLNSWKLTPPHPLLGVVDHWSKEFDYTKDGAQARCSNR